MVCTLHYSISAGFVHESAPAPTLILRPEGISPSWRSRERCHGRPEVEASPPQVQDQVQNSELARVRACPQEPGDVTIWLSAEAIAAWTPPKNGLRGGQRRYSDLSILTALTLRLVFRLPLRQTEGFLDSLLSWMDLDLNAPDHTTLSRRNQIVQVQPLTRAHDGPIDLIVDSTGLKIVGSGEWNVRKHKASKRRLRKFVRWGDESGRRSQAITGTHGSRTDFSDTSPCTADS